jgi:glycosyltransferase involved in cell wall biosynthesis
MPAERITYGHMAADTEGLRTAATVVTAEGRKRLREQLDVRGLMFLYVGRFIALKGLLELISAWKLIETSLAEGATLCLVGDGPLREELESRGREDGIRGLRLLGAKEPDELAPYYAAADVFVMPTLEDNWSLVVPEAMACGLPILCSKYNGCYPELVEPGGNGWVFDPLDEQDTFAALKRCVENRDRLAAMGARSREIVADHTPAHAAEAILRACELAIAHRRQ